MLLGLGMAGVSEKGGALGEAINKPMIPILRFRRASEPNRIW
jgi:hypothetical protein